MEDKNKEIKEIIKKPFELDKLEHKLKKLLTELKEEIDRLWLLEITNLPDLNEYIKRLHDEIIKKAEQIKEIQKEILKKIEEIEG